MKFILQSDKEIDTDRDILEEILKRNHFTHEYTKVKMSELKNKLLSSDISEYTIPVGTIEFVTEYLGASIGLVKENPIEVPKYLRTKEFLKREYNIVTWDKIPRSGRYFIKDASTLKHFSYNGNLEFFIQEEMFEEPKQAFDTSLRFSKNSLYVVSEEVDILGEYRVYIIDSEIEAIAQYDGLPLILPDTELINKAVKEINKNEKWLKSYTIDIMVTNRGTSVIEVHNFTSCGLYTTLFGDNLTLAYKQGIDYLKYDNKEIEI